MNHFHKNFANLSNKFRESLLLKLQNHFECSLDITSIIVKNFNIIPYYCQNILITFASKPETMPIVLKYLKRNIEHNEIPGVKYYQIPFDFLNYLCIIFLNNIVDVDHSYEEKEDTCSDLIDVLIFYTRNLELDVKSELLKLSQNIDMDEFSRRKICNFLNNLPQDL